MSPRPPQQVRWANSRSRGVAQSGSAPGLGPGGRGFKSRLLDHPKPPDQRAAAAPVRSTDRGYTLGTVFTLEQVTEIHDRLGHEETLVEWLEELRAVGVRTCDSFLEDGHSTYFGADGHAVSSGPAHETLIVADTCDREGVIEYVRRLGETKPDYVEMSRHLAESGVAKWTFDTTKLTIAYYDKAGDELEVEAVGGPRR